MGKYFSRFFSLSVFKESCKTKETHVNKLKLNEQSSCPTDDAVQMRLHLTAKKIDI